MAADDQRLANGRFKKGHRQLGHRRKGTPNKLTRTVKEAMDLAAQALGGAEGSAGVFVKAGKKDIVAFAQMLSRTIPLEVKAETTSVGPPIVVQMISVPAGCFLTKEQAQALYFGEPTTLAPPPAAPVLVIDNKTNNADALTIDNTKDEPPDTVA
jgi:hypothetical protein